MKKLASGFAVVLMFGVIVLPSSAAAPKSLVIVDSYFDSKVSSPSVKCIVLSTNKPCTDLVTVKNSSLSHDINHGNAMVEVAKKQNPNLSMILLSSAAVSAKSVSGVNAGNLIDALRWVEANSSTIGAVSLSRYMNGRKECSPASINTAPHGGVAKADQIIRTLIANLNSKGIPVFVSTGNKRGTKIDYPACIRDTVSVSTGSLDSQGNVVSGNAFDANTDYVASADLFSYNSPVFGLIPQTTSSATVAVAAQWLSTGNLSNRVVQVLP